MTEAHTLIACLAIVVLTGWIGGFLGWHLGYLAGFRDGLDLRARRRQ